MTAATDRPTMRSILVAVRTGPWMVLVTNALVGLTVALAGAPWFGAAIIALSPIQVVSMKLVSDWLQKRVETISPVKFDAILATQLFVTGACMQGLVMAAMIVSPSPALAIIGVLIGVCVTLVAMNQSGMRPRVYIPHSVPPFALLCVAAAAHGFSASIWQGVAVLIALVVAMVTLSFLAAHTLKSNARIATLALKRKILVEELQNKSDAATQDALRLQMAMELADTAAWDIDLDQRKVIGSTSLARVLGRDFTYDAFVNGMGLAMIAPEDRERVNDVFTHLIKAPCRQVIEHRVLLPDGNLRWVHSTGQSMADAKGRVRRILILTSDITGRKVEEHALMRALAQAEVALSAKRALLNSLHADNLDQAQQPASTHLCEASSYAGMQERLNAMLTEIESRDRALENAVSVIREAQLRAEEANHAKSQFLATMSHELRTPLNAIIGYSEILREGAELDARGSDLEDHDRILAAAHRLLRMIGEVLDFSKIDAGKMEVDSATFSVSDMTQDIIATVRPQIEAKKNTLVVKLGADLGEANTDAFKLSQCVLNLLSNAAKFTSGGVITLRVEREPRVDGSWLTYSVSDTGIGISPDALAKLFQPFTQADATTTRAYGGTGLGLAITARIAEILGGEVTAASAPGKGSTFTLAVPAEWREPQARAAA